MLTVTLLINLLLYYVNEHSIGGTGRRSCACDARQEARPAGPLRGQVHAVPLLPHGVALCTLARCSPLCVPVEGEREGC
jgi:hypothetical protein